MQLKTLFASVLLAAPVFSSPVPDKAVGLEDRAPKKCPVIQPNLGTVSRTLDPKLNKSKVRTFTVDVRTAIEQARAGGLVGGPSGDPHPYYNLDKINWDEDKAQVCNNPRSVLMEYPVYWTTAKVQAWDKNVKKVGNQEQNTPIRVVYANHKGCIFYCGVMIHEEVSADFQGSGRFRKMLKPDEVDPKDKDAGDASTSGTKKGGKQGGKQGGKDVGKVKQPQS